MSMLFTGRATSGASSRKVGLVRRFIMFWLDHFRQALFSLGELWRTPSASILTIAVLGVSLTLPTTLHLLVKNVQQISDSFTEAAEISLFIKEGSTETQIASLVHILQADKDIARVSWINKQQALAEFSQVSGFGTALSLLSDNPLPDVLLVLPQNTAAEQAKQLLTRLQNEALVETGKLDIDWLTRLDAIVSLLRQAVLVIALLLLLSLIHI